MDNDLILTDAEGTPASYGDTVQLVLDKLGNESFGPELFTNGDFATGDFTGYEAISAPGFIVPEVTFENKGRMEVIDPGVSGSPRITQIVSNLIVGKVYEVSATLSSYRDVPTASTFGLVILGNDFGYGGSAYRNGVVTWKFVANASSVKAFEIYARRFAGGTEGDFFEVGNISVRELKGFHSSQNSSSLKPVYDRVLADGQYIEYLRFDFVDDKMVQTFPDGLTGDLVVCGTEGSWVDEGVSIAPGGDLEIGPTGLPNTPRIFPALGDIIGWVPVDRTLTEDERNRVIDYYKGRGAKGLLVPSGNELITGSYDDLSVFTSTVGSVTYDADTGGAVVSEVSGADASARIEGLPVNRDKAYCLEFEILDGADSILLSIDKDSLGSDIFQGSFSGIGIKTVYFISPLDNANISFANGGGDNGSVTIGNISVEELSPQEDL